MAQSLKAKVKAALVEASFARQSPSERR